MIFLASSSSCATGMSCRCSSLETMQEILLTSFGTFDNVMLPFLEASFEVLFSNTLVVQPVAELVDL